MRARARTWCTQVAGERVHGTIRRRPLEVFRKEERACLLPYDGEPYEVGRWQSATVQPDHHVQAKYALYSLPRDPSLVGQAVEIKIERSLVRIYHRGVLIKVHPRQGRGGRSTDPGDLPEHLARYRSRDPEIVRERAGKLGPAIGFYADALLGTKPTWAHIRSVHALVDLGERFGSDVL